MNRIVQILMQRDQVSEEEANEIMNDMVSDMEDGADPEDLLYDIGLEPDYVDDLLEWEVK